MHGLCPYLGATDLCYSPNRGLRHGKKLGMAYPSFRLALICAPLLLAVFSRAAGAAEIYAGDGVEARWDNTLRYSLALRPFSADAELLSYINGDDGDRNFAPGIVSNRIDWLSVFDLSAGDVGIHASSAAWYDTAYLSRTNNGSVTTSNAAAPAGQFARAAKNLEGRHIELDDAFAFGNFALDDIPVSLRAGRMVQLGGESRFFDPNSIAAAMAPADYLKTMTSQDGYSGNMFLPVAQVSLTVQPLPWLSVSFYDQLEWRASRQPADGSYLSYVDYVGVGAARLFLSPDQYLNQNPVHVPASGQYGVTLRASVADMDLGLYALHFRSRDPIAILSPDQALANRTGAVGSYSLVYPANVDLYGASFSTEMGPSTLAGEISARQNMPLVNYDSRTPQLVTMEGVPYYARGDTLHTQISLLTELAETFLWDRADATAEIAADNVLDYPEPAAGVPSYSDFALKARARIEPRYFQVLPNLDVTGLAELGFNLAGHSFTYYAQNSGTGDFRLGVSGVYLSAWKAGVSYVGFLGAPTRQPLADRDFVMLSLERTF